MVDKSPEPVNAESNDAAIARIGRELKTVRELLNKYVFAQHEAEAEVPEKIRRFVTYVHALHDIVYIYEERGVAAPAYIMQEMQRCDDRLRQLIVGAHKDGGTFERVRREMVDDPDNRWDHTRQITHRKATP